MPDNNVPRIPDFNMLRRIGGGSYGVVWIARSLTGIYRAVKVVERARFADARPFLRELDGITRFQQTVGNEPRQLALMHVGRDDEQGIFYYVMELADDVDASTDINPELYVPLTLKALRERRHLLPAAECVRLGIELARALAGLHAAGLIHRDVKPSNIIFVNGVPKLADVGLVSSSDHTLTSLGTPGYAPPEGAGTMEADVYGLGKILYELATGCPTTDFPRLPAEVTTREDTPLLLELNEVLLRACHPDPRERYPSAQTMLDDLLLLQAGKSVKELVRTKHRLRVLARASGIAALIALAALGVLGWKNYQSARQLAAQEAAARQQAEQDERMARYSADLHLAQLALNGGDFGVARSALRRQIPAAGESDLRGIEWRALWNETAGDAQQIWGTIGGAPVRAAVLSPDGTKFASQEGESQRETVVWDLATSARRVLARETFGLGGFSSDGTRLIVGTPDRRLRVLDAQTGDVLANQAIAGRLMQFLADGKTALIATRVEGDNKVALWDVEQARELVGWRIPVGAQETRVSAYAASNNGELIAASTFWTEGTLRRRRLVIWNARENREAAANEEVERAQTLAFSPDGQSLAVGMAGEPVFILSTGTGVVRLRLKGHHGNVVGVAFSPDGRKLATAGSDGTLRIWDAENGQNLAVLRGHEAGVNTVMWTEDGAQLLSTSDDGTARSWRAGAEKSQRSMGGFWDSSLGDALPSRDGKELWITDRAGQVAVVDSRTLQTTRVVPELFQALAWTGDGTQLLAIDRNRALLFYDRNSGTTRLVGSASDSSRRIEYDATSSDGRWVVLSRAAGVLELFDTSASTRRDLPKTHETNVEGMVFSRDGVLFASGDANGMVWLHPTARPEAPRRLLSLPSGVRSLTFSNDRAFLFVGLANGAILVSEVESGRVIANLRGHDSPVTALAVSPDGGRLLSGGREGVVICWSIETLRQVGALTLDRNGEASREIFRMHFDAAATKLTAFTYDGRIQVWSLER